MSLTERDRTRMADVDGDVVLVVDQAAEDNPGLFFVGEGARPVAKQLEYMAAGTSKVENPYSSKHVIGPKRPKAEAVDLHPLGYPRLDVLTVKEYRPIAVAMRAAQAKVSARVGRTIVLDWGYDLWKWDCPHFQKRA